ncbi:MAG: 4-hydroxy-tetrahydrodipicolinate synthase [Prevotellaceae bacterium]|nr:4-hydroxy-tetrahydrodipicolinate synthase [Prevotellaceae bacterium]
MTKFFGTGVALVTPFDANGNVDYTALANLVKYVSDGGVSYLVALGTTAETPTLTADEKDKILACIKSANAGKLPMMLGVGGNSTSDVIEKIKHTDFSGVDALLSVAPYYNKPSQAGMQAHYTAIADASPVPVVLYNVPSRTVVNIAPETTLRLAQHKNIIGIKEASGNLTQMGYILRDKSKDFLVISGDDGLAVPLVSIGGHGLISVAANVCPKQVSDMVNFALAQKNVEAGRLHLSLMELVDALFAEGSPVGIKCALQCKSLAENVLRLPLVQASAALTERMKKILS